MPYFIKSEDSFLFKNCSLLLIGLGKLSQFSSVWIESLFCLHRPGLFSSLILLVPLALLLTLLSVEPLLRSLLDIGLSLSKSSLFFSLCYYLILVNFSWIDFCLLNSSYSLLNLSSASFLLLFSRSCFFQRTIETFLE